MFGLYISLFVHVGQGTRGGDKQEKLSRLITFLSPSLPDEVPARVGRQGSVVVVGGSRAIADAALCNKSKIFASSCLPVGVLVDTSQMNTGHGPVLKVSFQVTVIR